MKIAMVGAGAIGSFVGGGLARAGEDVTLIDFWPDHIAAIRADGLHISGMTDEETFTVHAKTMNVADVQRLARERPIDIAFIAVKSYDTDWATTLIAPYLAPGGYVVSLQNGINEERMAAIVGWGKVLGCVPSIPLELWQPGHVRRTNRKGSIAQVFRVGEPHGRITDRLKALCALLSQVDFAVATPNLWGERWSKLCINVMRNGIAAATGLSDDQADRDEHIRRFAFRLGAEAVRVGEALGFALEPTSGFDLYRLALAGEGDADALAEVEAITARKMSTGIRNSLMRPSMGQDMAKGRRTEIEDINGLVVRKGQEIGIPTPLNAMLNDLVQRVYRGELEPGPDNLRGYRN